MAWKEPVIKVLAVVSVAITVLAFGMLYLAISRTSQ